MKVEKLYRDALDSLDKKIVVLDDDPTGVQTVHEVAVITDWEKETLVNEFNEDKKIFFILTNSRGFTRLKRFTKQLLKTLSMHQRLLEKNIL
ncbi:four-carbon acid sugar kinase family protein [uncultured Ilyobacter sp.]|uniref:four-carbon acid sugar kinase family protein n=1 Tax=uncultured Ilyobacter sp. TaxID=544433 RepID=UPI00374977D0